MAYRHFKDLTMRTAPGKILRDKAFNIAKNPKNDGYKRDLTSMFFLIKNLLRLQINLLLVMLLKMKICQSKN